MQDKDDFAPQQMSFSTGTPTQGVAPRPTPQKTLYQILFSNKSGPWTAVFTFFLVVFSGLLWRVNENANQASQAQERAFLSYGGPFPMKAVVNKKLTGVNFTYTESNSGQTPTKKVDVHLNMYLGSTLPTADFESLPQSEKTSFVLGPKVAIQMQPFFVSTTDLEAVQAGKKHLFFWSYSVYHDVFAGTPARLSEICSQVESVTWTSDDHSDPGTDLNFSNPPCPSHNCYDEQCDDYAARTK